MLEIGNEIHVDEYGNPFLLLKSIFIGRDSKVFGKTQLSGNAKIYQSAQVADKAKIYGNAHIYGKSVIFEHAEVYDNARINGTA